MRLRLFEVLEKVQTDFESQYKTVEKWAYQENLRPTLRGSWRLGPQLNNSSYVKRPKPMRSVMALASVHINISRPVYPKN
ncbi:hypothetical protein BGZ97_013337 [Linnemannia gamsii]|uniref:Uncharacterized protein n=1 Tax=Linnemannia gamsii TaxID=64522 RepID=A0A9P6RK86_9FUNG|nr:hypothetical protein BGZ97_013337 [Linnemannia gamsii]